MKIECVWEHNGEDTLLYASQFPGAFSRGENLHIATEKMKAEINSYLRWKGCSSISCSQIDIVQDASCHLQVCDADSDVLFDTERLALSMDEYMQLKALTLKSAEDFHELYQSIPNKNDPLIPPRSTFYGQIPCTAEEIYTHTKNVNSYYFGEIDVETDNIGSIMQCRINGFEKLEENRSFLDNCVFDGSYGELWTLRKMLRRFIWHDRIHAKSLYRRCAVLCSDDVVFNPFCF